MTGDVPPSSLVIGFSSHDSGIAMAVAAYVLGGRIVEKHFTLNRAMRGSDHAFSLEPQGLAKMVRDLERAHVACLPGVIFGPEGEGHLRFSFSTSIETIERGLEALRLALS